MSSSSKKSTSVFQITQLSFACAVFCASSSFAQSTPTESGALAPVTVTATRAKQSIKDALADVSVMDAQTVAQATGQTVGELLQREHGVEINSYGGPQTPASIFLRGANSAHTLVLLDGMRLNTSTGGIASLNALPLSSIGQIEILRGPASSLFGADAIGGVINLISQPAANGPFNPFASIGYGSWNTVKANVGTSGTVDNWNYLLNVGHEKSDGYNTFSPTQKYGYNQQKDGYELNNVNGHVGYTWAPQQDLSLAFFQSKLEGQSNGGTSFMTGAGLTDLSKTTVQAFSLQSNNKINDAWTSHLKVAQTRDNSEYFPGDPFSANSVNATRQTQYAWQNDFSLSKSQKASVSVERLDENVTSTNMDAAALNKRHTNSLNGVYQLETGIHHLQLNGRLDDNSQYGTKASGGISYGINVTKGWRLVAGANNGFHAPTFSDLYYKDSYGDVGNPNLKPETARNFELGVRYDDKFVQGKLTAYHNKVDNLIVWQSVPGSYSYTPMNVNHAVLEGISTGIDTQIPSQAGMTTLRAALDWQYPHDADTGLLLPNRARLIGKFSADHKVYGILVGAEFIGQGKRYNDTANTTPLAGFGLVNLYAAYDVAPKWTLQARWNNIFDKVYELRQGYATSRSNVFVNLAYKY